MGELQTLARDIGADERTLRRAVRTGTIHARRLSPRTLRVAATETEYLRRRWTLLTTLRSALRTERNVRMAVLFGSVARGTERPDSDLDVLVAVRDPSLPELAALEANLTRAARREVNVVVVEDALRDGPHLVLAALDHGRVLIDRESRWPALMAGRDGLERKVRTKRSGDRRKAADAVALLEAL